MAAASPAIEPAESPSHLERGATSQISAGPAPTQRSPDKSLAHSPHNAPISSPRRRSLFQWLLNVLRFELSLQRLLENQPIPHAEKLDQMCGSAAYFSPSDVFVLCYVVVTLPLFYWNIYTPPGIVLLELLIHLTVGFSIITLRTTECFKRRRIVLLFFDMYTPLLILFLYKEMGNFFFYFHLNSDTWDPSINRIEVMMFHCQPSQELHKWFEYRLLGEYLYWCYASLFPLLGLTTLLLYAYLPKKDAAAAQGGLFFTYLACAVIWLIFPVKGPFETYGGADPSSVGYFMSYRMNALVDSQHSTGTAFPSSHCAMGICFLIISYRHFSGTRWNWIYLLVVPGLIVSTVYGGFHYAIDSLCGCTLALLSYPIGNSLSRRLCSRFEFPDDRSAEPIDYEMIKVI